MYLQFQMNASEDFWTPPLADCIYRDKYSFSKEDFLMRIPVCTLIFPLAALAELPTMNQ